MAAVDLAGSRVDIAGLQRLDSSQTERGLTMGAILAIVGFLVFVFVAMYIDHRHAHHPRKSH